ncbi:hypothetical protein BJV77DRAFT_1148481 [Russula vinacea]|nr:hypothetical protein BJV77DRAFT_1148481 [Russula vinacea]
MHPRQISLNVVDAAQVSTSLRSRGPVAQSLKLVLLGWSAKVDLQPRLDRDAAIKYISEYASEPETVSVGYQPRLGRLLRPHAPKAAVRRLFVRMATADRDITAQKAVYLLLRDHLVDAQHLLRDHNNANDDDPAFEASFFACYQATRKAPSPQLPRWGGIVAAQYIIFHGTSEIKLGARLPHFHVDERPIYKTGYRGHRGVAIAVSLLLPPACLYARTPRSQIGPSGPSNEKLVLSH